MFVSSYLTTRGNVKYFGDQLSAGPHFRETYIYILWKKVYVLHRSQVHLSELATLGLLL